MVTIHTKFHILLSTANIKLLPQTTIFKITFYDILFINLKFISHIGHRFKKGL